ncbi:hypothetical protein [Cellulomonas sp. NS3]|uniref:hypothetical protein n=1 Tax=Cellulomonas sp. NS3 TaxID=2973977 RepID=UPI002162E31F|nr:hypothetical protein [Cellulomonas sp. NS3]
MRGSRSAALVVMFVGILGVGGCLPEVDASDLEQRARDDAARHASNLLFEMTEEYALISQARDAPLLRMLDDAMEANEHRHWAEKRSGTPTTSVWDVSFTAVASGGGMLPPRARVRLCAELSFDLGRETVVELDNSTCPSGAPRPSGAVDVELPIDEP